MNPTLREDCDLIVRASIAAVLPDEAVREALKAFVPAKGKTLLVAIGKAGWQMAQAAVTTLRETKGFRVDEGIVITKYDHVKGDIDGCVCCEAGHPVPDENTYASTQKALDLVRGLSADDEVLFLVSGGGSALFEKPLIAPEEMGAITKQLLASGAAIEEMNTIRKHLSGVKGGRFAQACAPAKVFAIILSDVIGDPVDVIAGGPAAADTSTCAEARAIVEKYGLKLSAEAMETLSTETPKTVDNVTYQITGSVRYLCEAAKDAAEQLGYEARVLTTELTSEARVAGRELAAYADAACTKQSNTVRPKAYIMGGETVVHLTGHGLGGRNQELALAAAPSLAGKNACLFSLGSDGTDGPTDAAGGYCDGQTLEKLEAAGLELDAILADNDAYHALQAVDGLIMTGPTGTNVNDVAVLLVR